MSVRLVWITPQAEDHLIYIAKVSNPHRQNDPSPRLIRYMMEHEHWSPFEMVNLCVEVNTTRDIGRQMLRHWTMRPQEFSQRYADVRTLGAPIFREARMQHKTNRQASLPCDDPEISAWWADAQAGLWQHAETVYGEALDKGLAKEVARVVMPEGITPTRTYYNSNIRSALHFCNLRQTSKGAQKEIAQIADEIRAIMDEYLPQTLEAFRVWSVVQ